MKKQSTTKTELEALGNISRGFKFSIKHDDGVTVQEVVSNIYRYTDHTEELKGRGFNQYYAVGKKVTTLVVCESCACYEHKEILAGLNN